MQRRGVNKRRRLPVMGNRRFGRLKNSKYSRFKNIPVISNKPITMGTGTATINVTDNIDSNIFLTVNSYLFSNLYSKVEFISKRAEYSYFKINFIKVIFISSFDPASSDSLYNYITVNWVNDNDLTESQLINSDNVKILGVFQPRTKVYTFIPPNIMVNGYNPSIFMSTQVSPYIGTLYYYLVKRKPFRIEYNVTFRGSRDYNIGGLLNDLKRFNLITDDVKEVEKNKKENDKNKIKSKSKNKNNQKNKEKIPEYNKNFDFNVDDDDSENEAEKEL